ITGPGVAALEQAKAEGRPIIVVSGHFGNFDAIRGALALRGYKIGALYRPLDDPRLETAFHTMLTHIADPVFPRGRSGLGQMLRFLKKGNTIALLLDQYVHEAAPLSFFGKPAPTSLSAAEMALKYKALLIPVYGIRRADGSFELRIESEIPHSSAPVMTQALNDDLERMIRAHMDQWLWIHRRWKPERQAKRRKRS
ncbi:MAG: lysophospholipid acyltransferase family protein, partial [Mangrovicoccus sp.]